MTVFVKWRDPDGAKQLAFPDAAGALDKFLELDTPDGAITGLEAQDDKGRPLTVMDLTALASSEKGDSPT
jgi:hypothetical protein